MRENKRECERESKRECEGGREPRGSRLLVPGRPGSGKQELQARGRPTLQRGRGKQELQASGRPTLQHGSGKHELQAKGRPTLLPHLGPSRDVSPPPGLNRELDKRFRRMKETADGKIPSETLFQSEESSRGKKVLDIKEKKTKLKVVWADHIGKSLVSSLPFNDGLPSAPLPPVKGNGRRHWFIHDRDNGFSKAREYSASSSYKEAC